MSKHTPGPWRVEPLVSSNGADMAICAPHNGWVVAVIQNDPDIQTIDEPDGDSVVWHEADKANAALIAAAPAMLAALQAIKQRRGNCGRSPWEQEACDMMDAAIAAATGNPTAAEAAPPPTTRPADGPYSPELAEAFRIGARELLNSETGDRINVDADARVEEFTDGDGGAIVHCTIFVSDAERAALAEEEAATCEQCGNTDNDGTDVCPDCGGAMSDPTAP